MFLINLFYRLSSLFQLVEKCFLCGCCLIFFCWVLFFIHTEYGIGLNVDVPKNQLHSDYFGNLDRVGNVVIFLYVIDQCQFLLRNNTLIGVMFHLSRDKIKLFGISTVVFCVSNSA